MQKKSFLSLAVLLLFGLAIFLAAGLMFVLEPLVAKMLLPVFGGAPSVWNTCVVFFQFMLLAGYLYAHLVGTKLSARHQCFVHLAVVWLPVLFLPLRPPVGQSIAEHPFLSLVTMLMSLVAVVFFAISTTAPLMQKWYSNMNSHGSSDPYFLYAASNAGSLLGLIAYPFWVEPSFRIVDQAELVRVIYVVYAVLVTLCSFALLKLAPAAGAQAPLLVQEDATAHGADRKVETLIPSQCFRWIVLAMLPSSLVLGVTTYITSELSAIPFFWVVPLVLYLLSFIVAFGRLPKPVYSFFKLLAPVLVLLVGVMMLSDTTMKAILGDELITSGLSLHLLALFFVCCACHSVIAAERPSSKYLTVYYLLISIGGVIGSSFNTFIAPLIFKECLEYPLVLFASLIALIQVPKKFPIAPFKTIDRWAQSLLIAICVLAITTACWAVNYFFLSQYEQSSVIGGALLYKDAIVEVAVDFALPIFFCWVLAASLKQFRLGLALVFLFAVSNTADLKSIVHQERNFFGNLSVTVNTKDNICEFWHGSVLHGTESIDPDQRGEPLAYYYPTGPLGKLMTKLYGGPETLESMENQSAAKSVSTDAPEQPDVLSHSPVRHLPPSVAQTDGGEKPGPVADIGLGCGTIVAYAKKGQRFDFYEINPQVVDIASNPFYFTFLFQAKERKVDLKIVEGDGRLEIQKAPYNFYQVIIVDAFSSDSIPMHLVTKEAVQVYLSKLRSDGVIVFNVSNHYYDIRPPLASLAQALGVDCMTFEDTAVAIEKERCNSVWVALTRSKDMMSVLKKQGWNALKPDKKMRLWTDDYCSPLSVLIAKFS